MSETSLDPRPPKNGGRPGTYCTCIGVHATNKPDILPCNSVHG